VYYRLSWWRNNDSLDVGLVANRLLARRFRVYWVERPLDPLEACDYLLECGGRPFERKMRLAAGSAASNSASSGQSRCTRGEIA
jgi:hypothetical protein